MSCQYALYPQVSCTRVRHLLGVYSGVWTSLQIEHACLDPFLLSLARLAFTIEVPDGLCEKLGNIWVVLLQVVPDGVAADLQLH
jgi:hypothetical protein